METLGVIVGAIIGAIIGTIIGAIIGVIIGVVVGLNVGVARESHQRWTQVQGWFVALGKPYGQAATCPYGSHRQRASHTRLQGTTNKAAPRTAAWFWSGVSPWPSSGTIFSLGPGGTRRSIRLRERDYSQPGTCFVAACTGSRERILGMRGLW